MVGRLKAHLTRSLEAVAERKILVIGHIQESFLDLNPLRWFAILAWNIDPTVLREFLFLLFGGGGCSGAITLLVLVVEVLADDEDEDGLATVGGENNGPRDTVAWLILGLPPLSGNHLADGVSKQPHAVQCEFLGMAGCGGGDP